MQGGGTTARVAHGFDVCRPPANRAPSSEQKGGSKGGAEHPLVSLRVIHGVCWLACRPKSASSQPGDGPKGPPERRPKTLVAGPSRASPSTSRSSSSRTTKATGPSRSSARRTLPYPYPSETRDRRSEALLRPVDSPKRLRCDRKRALNRVPGLRAHPIRPRSPLSGPRHAPPTHP